MTYLDIRVGDVAHMRKQHPCGGWQWEVVRTGADIGIVCTTCRRRLFLPRDKFRRSLKKLERPHPTSDSNDTPNIVPDT